MATCTRTELLEACKRIGLQCDYYSPGDGVTRYRFWTSGYTSRDKVVKAKDLDYFSAVNPLITVLGLGQAELFFMGFQHGAAYTRTK